MSVSNFLSGSVFSSPCFKFSAKYPIDIQECVFKFCNSTVNAGAISINVFTNVFISKCDYIECKGYTVGAIHIERVREANIQSERFSTCAGSICSSIYMKDCKEGKIDIEKGEDTNYAYMNYVVYSYNAKSNITNFNISSRRGIIFKFGYSTVGLRYCFIKKLSNSEFLNSKIDICDSGFIVDEVTSTYNIKIIFDSFIRFIRCDFTAKPNISNPSHYSFINCSFDAHIDIQPISFDNDGDAKVIENQKITMKIDFYRYNIIDIKHTHFIDLSSNECGGAIYTYRKCHAALYQTVFLRCYAQEGGCMFIGNITLNSVCFSECFAPKNDAFVFDDSSSVYTTKSTLISITGMRGYECSSYSTFHTGRNDFSELNCTRCHCNEWSGQFFGVYEVKFKESQFYNITGNSIFMMTMCLIDKSNLNEVYIVGDKGCFFSGMQCMITGCTISNIHNMTKLSYIGEVILINCTNETILYDKLFDCYEFPVDNKLSKSTILIISLCVACIVLTIALLIFFLYTRKIRAFANKQKRRNELESELMNDFG